MSTIKTHKARRNFTVIDNDILRSKDLSFKATGLYAYLAMLPDGWECRLSHLAKCKLDGRDAVRAAISELEAIGCLVKKTERNNDGTFKTIGWDFYEEPKDDHPFSDYPKTDNPNSENPTLLNTNNAVSTYTPENTNHPVSTDASSTVLGHTSQTQPQDQKRDASQILVDAFMEKSARQPFTNAQRARNEIPAILQDLNAYAEHIGTDIAKTNLQIAIDQMIAEGDPPHCITGALIRAKRDGKAKTTNAPRAPQHRLSRPLPNHQPAPVWADNRVKLAFMSDWVNATPETTWAEIEPQLSSERRAFLLTNDPRHLGQWPIGAPPDPEFVPGVTGLKKTAHAA